MEQAIKPYLKNTYIYTHINTYIHPYIHTNIHTYIYTYRHKYINTEIKKEKINSWKEYCKVTASTKTSQVYKLAARKIRLKNKITNLTN